ncbi:MAG: hypothetical protein B7Z15_05515 [Rhizobiales bacterium 32-66-8]|nr:MAG: hypothetical protein B7Z15_05515 [Rhizobiales bacterium 32-66-8]
MVSSTLPPIAIAVVAEEKIVTTEVEQRVFSWVKHRLAFLVRDDVLFQELNNIAYQDFQGSFVVYYKKQRAGRLFELYEPKAGSREARLRFVFPNGGGESEDMLVSELTEIDQPLLNVFKMRVSQLSKM